MGGRVPRLLTNPVGRQVVSTFIDNFFDQNPISQLALVELRQGKAEKITELSGNARHHRGPERSRQIQQKDPDRSRTIHTDPEMSRYYLPLRDDSQHSATVRRFFSLSSRSLGRAAAGQGGENHGTLRERPPPQRSIKSQQAHSLPENFTLSQQPCQSESAIVPWGHATYCRCPSS